MKLKILSFFSAQRRAGILLSIVKRGSQIWQRSSNSKQKERATDFEKKIANDQRGTFLNVNYQTSWK